MMFKKVMGLTMVLALTACGGGSKSKGEEKTKEQFDEAAAERTDVAGSGYNTASLKGTHLQRYNGQDAKIDYEAKYARDGDTWNVTEDNIPSSLATLLKDINFTMVYYSTFAAVFERTFSKDFQMKYYLADDSATLEISGESTSGNMVGTVAGEFEWNKFGLLTRWHEKDDFSSYMGYQGVVIEETMNFTYAA